MTRKFFNEFLEEIGKKSKKYNFILKAGQSFKEALYKIFRHVWESEKKPASWRLDTLVQIHKKNCK